MNSEYDDTKAVAHLPTFILKSIIVALGKGELSPIFGDGLKDQAAAVWD